MTEQSKLKLLIFITALIGITGYYTAHHFDFRLLLKDLTGDYKATITLDRDVLLDEEYIYHVKMTGMYRMLYRYWKAPLIFEGEYQTPHLKVESISTPYNWYVKDFKGKIFGNLDIKEKLLVKEKAYLNEIGIIDIGYFSSGEYPLKIRYTVVPPVEVDDTFMHINLKLADDHIPYRTVRITVKDPLNKVVKVFSHISNASVKKTEEGFLIEGSSPENKLVEIEILAQKYPVNGVLHRVPDVFDKTVKANKQPLVSTLGFIHKGLVFLVLLFPVYFYFFYTMYGREKNFTVPAFLSFVPDKGLKPYLVNLVFNSDATTGDENGFYATLLDLHFRKKILIEDFGTDLQIKILDDTTSDPYERAVFRFLKGFTLDKDKTIFSTAVLEHKIKSLYRAKDVYRLKMLKNQMDRIFKYYDRRTVSRYLDTTGKKVFYAVSIPLLLITGGFSAAFLVLGINRYFPYYDLYPIFILGITLSSQILIVLKMPSQFLGKWKKDAYKQKLQWDGFKRFLSDLVSIKKYAPEDLIIWKEWLIYGTALGVAKKVEKAMRILNIKIPEIQISRITRVRFHRIYTTAGRNLASLQAASKGTGGGGFGVGGGFGGGGAGGR